MATEVKQRNNKVLLLVGAVLAVAAFGLSLYVSRSSSNNSSSSGQTVPVVVAKADLAKGAQLTADQLTVVQYGVDQVPAGSAPNDSTLVGKFLAVSVSKNTPITSSLIAVDANAAKAAALPLAPLDIHPGFVALAIPATAGGATAELTSIGCYVHTDDHLDMLVDTKGDGSVRYGFQDVRVLQVLTNGAATAAGACPTAFVVEMPRAQAEELAALVSGKIPTVSVVKYVLRPQKEYGKGYEDIADPSVPQKKDQAVTPQVLENLFAK